MKKVRKVVCDKDTGKITLKGFLGKVLFEIRPVGDFIFFEETLYLGRLKVSVYRTRTISYRTGSIVRDKIYNFLITEKSKQKLLEMLKPTHCFNDPYQQYYTTK